MLPLQLLAELFATLVPMRPDEARRRAALAIETLEATRSRSDLFQLGLALRALDGGPMHRFRRAGQEERERMLLAWASSPIPQLRTTFQVIKRLGLFLACADPGPDPSSPANPLWEVIGYAPPLAPEEPADPLVRPMELPRATRDDEPLRLEAEVVVVGSGAGGGVVAARLGAAGRDVLVVEAAEELPEPEMPVLEAEAWRDLYLDRGTTATDDLAVAILAGSSVGGGTTVNWTTSLPPPEWVRDEWEREHRLGPWNSFDGDLGRLSEELRLLPPSVVPPKERLILDGARALGWEAEVNRRNAGPCTDCGGCGFGCARGEKRGTRRVHLAMAQASGARLLAGARVRRVLHAGGRVRGVTGRLGSGRRFVVRAPQVVLAAGALRTPLILQASGVEHRAVGRHLRLHPVVAIGAFLAEPADPWIGPLQAARSLQFAASGSGAGQGGFVIESAPPHPGLAASALPWSGRAEAERFLRRMRQLAPLIGIVRDTGDGGEVRLRRGGRGSIRYRLSPADGEMARRALVAMAQLGCAGGAEELVAATTPAVRWADGEPFEPFAERLASVDLGANRVGLLSAHQMGSVRAGADPRSHPCDPEGRVRTDARGTLLRGVYVADASVFPSAVGVNPMLTVMLLAEGVARTVAGELP
jgi:choline dehydrogenase-like flavoprotein